MIIPQGCTGSHLRWLLIGQTWRKNEKVASQSSSTLGRVSKRRILLCCLNVGSYTTRNDTHYNEKKEGLHGQFGTKKENLSRSKRSHVYLVLAMLLLALWTSASRFILEFNSLQYNKSTTYFLRFRIMGFQGYLFYLSQTTIARKIERHC